MTYYVSTLSASLSGWFHSLFSSSEEYENLGITGGSMIPSIVIGIAIGFLIASCMAIFDKRVLGDFVRQVLSYECLSRESAKTLEELGYHKNSFVRGALKSGVSLRRVVKCVEEEIFLENVEKERAAYEAAKSDEKKPKFREPKFKMDVSVMHFYIPEEMKYMADVKFEKKGTGVHTLVLAFVLVIAITFALLFFIPELLQMLDNMLGMFDWRSNVLT